MEASTFRTLTRSYNVVTSFSSPEESLFDHEDDESSAEAATTTSVIEAGGFGGGADGGQPRGLPRTLTTRRNFWTNLGLGGTPPLLLGLCSLALCLLGTSAGLLGLGFAFWEWVWALSSRCMFLILHDSRLELTT